MKLLIKNGRVVDPSSRLDRRRDVVCKNGKIAKIGEGLREPGATVIDAAGMVVVPGLVDMHVHLREPGNEDKETIESGSRAAASGGFTSIACMPNTNPVLDNRTHIKYVIATAEREACVHVFPMGAVTAGQKGEKLTELGDMAECGAVAFSDDGRCVENAGLMRRALEYSKAVGRVIVQHCQDGPLTVDAMVNEGVVSTRLGLKGFPIIAEEIIAERDARLAKYCDARIHITHISTRGTVEIVRRAKRMGVELTCDVTPHHLLLTEEECLGFDTSFKMNPPLRTKKDVEVLEKALEDGTIDAVGSDHAPHTDYEKGLEFSTAPFGVIGLETTVPILLTHFVRAKKIGWPRFVELLSVNPARILGLRGKGSLAVGSDADVTVIDPELSFEYKPEEVVSKSRNSPFFGRRFVGRAVHTIVGGRVVMKDRVLRT